MATNSDDKNSNALDITRDRAIRLFRFLQGISELRTPPIRSLDKYEQVVWLDTIPHVRECFCVAWKPENANKADAWIEVGKTKLILPPNPSEELLPWTTPDLLNNSSVDYPALCEQIVIEHPLESAEGAILSTQTIVIRLEDHPEIQTAWDAFVRNSWHIWAEKDRLLKQAQIVYNALYAIYQQQQSFGEEYEVILGLGYLTWNTPSGHTIKRHLISAQLNLTFDQARARVSVVPSAEGTKTTFEQDMLDPDECPDAAEFRKIEQLITDMGDGIWGDDSVHTILTSWLNTYPDSTEYSDLLSRHLDSQNYPMVSFAPAIILRRRTERGLLRVFKDICDQLKDKTKDVPEGVKVIVDDPDDQQYSADDDQHQHKTTALSPDSDVYFPLPANEQQSKIAHQITRNQGVLVQGPPGTGKSHTITNLVCHLLATGNRVLVTSQTSRALKVLRDKFPSEIAPLCVVALSNDKQSMNDLEGSVSGITQRKNLWDESANSRLIEKLEKTVDVARRNEVKLINDLRSIREAETLRHHAEFGDYTGTLQNIAARIKDEEALLGWLPFNPEEDAEPPISDAEAQYIIEVLNEFDANMRVEVRQRIIEPSSLPTPSDFARYVTTEAEAVANHKALKDIQDRREYGPISKCSPGLRADMSTALGSLRKYIKTLMLDTEPWIQTVIDDLYHGRTNTWIEIRDMTRKYLDMIGDNARIAHEYDIIGLGEGDRSIHKANADELLRHLSSGGKLKLWYGARPKPVKDAQHLIENVYVNGKLCDSIHQLQCLLKWFEVISRFDALDSYWREYSVSQNTSLPMRKAEYENLYDILTSCLDLRSYIDNAQKALSSVIDTSDINWIDTNKLDELEQTVNAVYLEEEMLRSTIVLQSLEQSVHQFILSANVHLFVKSIYKSITNRDIEIYSNIYQKLVELQAKQKRLDKCYSLLDKLHQAYEPLKNIILLYVDDVNWRNRMMRFEAAWNWKRTDAWLNRISNPAEHKRLSDALNIQKLTILNTLAQLSAAKAWHHCMHRLTTHQTEHLRAWQQTMKNFGKGTGMHANKDLNDARYHLKECRSAIPAWIMPIYRVADTMDIEPNIFDVVIVDEASQSGPEALFLQYIAKKIIVVGDAEQISPSFVGIPKEPVDKLREQFINDLPHHDRMGIEHSFFDLAFIRFQSHICLQEHFRCMPEIIQFSNNLCYSSTPLIPLKQYGAGRLTPTVIAVHVSTGYQKGRSHGITNPPEAEALVAQIASCCKNPLYKGKTIGIISLLGDEQAKMIQTLLMDRIGTAEMERRQIRCGDAYAFQGDERDVIFLSMVTAPGENHRIGTLSDSASEKRFNVACSRAKEQMWLFHTAILTDLKPNCLRYRLLNYCQNPKLEQTDISGIHIEQLRTMSRDSDRRLSGPPIPFDSWFEVDVFLRILDQGYRCIPQYKVAGYYIDLVVQGMQGCLAVECDGDEWHGPEQYDSDTGRQRQLERSGYTFWRVRGSAFYRAPDEAMQSLWQLLKHQGILPGVSDGIDEPDEISEADSDAFVAISDIEDVVFVDGDDNDLSIEELDETDDDQVPQPSSEVEHETSLGPHGYSFDRAHIEHLPAPAEVTDIDRDAEADDFEPPLTPSTIPALARLSGLVSSTEKNTDGGISIRNAGRGVINSPCKEPMSSYGSTNFVIPEYIAYAGTTQGDPRTVSLTIVANGLVQIIDAEGPMVAKRAYDTYLRGCGIKRMGHDLKSTMNKALAMAIREGHIVYVNEDGKPGFLYSIVRVKGSELVRLRGRGPRTFDEIPPSELKAIARILADRDGLVYGSEDHKRAILDQYDLVRLTAPVQAILDKVLG